MSIDRSLLFSQFRAVDIDRLPTILELGIDVEPTDSPFYADDFDKAWEYGGWPKVVLAFDRRALKRTFIEVPSSLRLDELELLKKTFPTIVPSNDGAMLWLSRLPESDPRLASPYEAAYAHWIEIDPFKALQAIMIFFRPGDENSVSSALPAALPRLRLDSTTDTPC